MAARTNTPTDPVTLAYADLLAEESFPTALLAAVRRLRDGDRIVLYDGPFAQWRAHEAGVIVRLGKEVRSVLLLNGHRTVYDGALADDWHVDAGLAVFDARRTDTGLDIRRNGKAWQLRRDDPSHIVGWSVLPHGLHLTYAAPLIHAPNNKSVIRIPMAADGALSGKPESVFAGEADDVRYLFDTFCVRRVDADGSVRWLREGQITVGFGDEPDARPHPHGFMTQRLSPERIQVRFNGEELYTGPGEACAPHPQGVIIQEGQRLTLVIRQVPGSGCHLDDPAF